MADTYDVIIIGAGPGGYVAAIRAAQLGFKTAVVDREHLGGICLNWGCIPTKALLRSAEIYHYMQHPGDYGLTSRARSAFDAAAVVKRSRGVSKRLNGGVGFLLKKNKVDVIWGEAAIERAKGGSPARSRSRRRSAPSRRRARSGAGTYQAKHIIVATGARPRALPGHRARQEADLDLLRGDGARTRCRNRCSSWARARSASSSPRSTAPWAPR